MSWNARNLYNLWSRSVGPHSSNKFKNNITRFQESSLSLFKQRWQSKKLVRAYHGDYIPEKKFIRWYLPERLPDPMAKQGKSLSTKPGQNAEAAETAKSKSAEAWARPGQKFKEAAEEGSTRENAHLAPISSLMFAELERRIDVIVFRSCFAHSIHAARQLVVHGKVRLNGIKESNPNTRLNPGDMISVDPEAMTILRPPPQAEKAESTEKKETSAEASESESKTEAGSSETTTTTAATSTADPAFALPPYAAPFIFIPAYLEVNFPTCSAIYVRHPTARPRYSEIPSPYDADGEIVRFAWEWYGKNRTRIRGWKREMRDIMEKGKSGWDGRVD
ncbi:mitochondrial 37S ribosomal protein nam9 [Tulasnella sp. 425]|nr:mitochondrial 37S ribosomal protein nam9 [Tulasnella sp. 425]